MLKNLMRDELKIDNSLACPEEQKIAEDIVKADEKKKTKVLNTVQKLLEKGFRADDILKLLEISTQRILLSIKKRWRNSSRLE